MLVINLKYNTVPTNIRAGIGHQTIPLCVNSGT